MAATRRTVLFWICRGIVFIPFVFFLYKMWGVRWIGDDGLINTRVVYNLLDGFGPVYNVDERVEAFTSPLWILLLAVMGGMGISPDAASVYLGYGLSALGMLLAIFGSLEQARVAGEETPRSLAIPLGMLVYAVIPAAWDYGTSGLETGLGLAWLGGLHCFLAIVVRASENTRPPKTSRVYGYTALLGLGPLIRPEMALFSLGMFVPLLLIRFPNTKIRDLIRLKSLLIITKLGLVMGAMPVAYQLFRMGYFAALTSNTAIAKEAFLGNWGQGWRYFENFFGLYLLAIPITGLAYFFVMEIREHTSRIKAAAMLAPVVCGVLYCLFVIKVGGDFMHGRFFLPGLFGMLLPVSVVFPSLAGKWVSRVVSIVLIAGILGWAIYCASSLRMTIGNQHGIGDERGWYTRRAVTRNPLTVKDYRRFASFKDARRLRKQAKAACDASDGNAQAACERYVLLDKPRYGKVKTDDKKIPLNPSRVHDSANLVVMRGGIGVFGTAARSAVHVVDRYGLVDPIASRLKIGRRGRPGHEKAFTNAWLVARFGEANDIKDKRVNDAAGALACEPLAELIDAVSEPLTVNRFMKNIAAAFVFQNLRVPRNPVEARRKFCR